MYLSEIIQYIITVIILALPDFVG